MIRVSECIFFQRRQMANRLMQQTHAKMLNITYQGNASQNYNEILPTSLRMAIIKKTTIYQVLARVRRKVWGNINWCESEILLLSHVQLTCDSMDCSLQGSWNFPGKNTGMVAFPSPKLV